MSISLDDAKSVAFLYEASLNRQADLGGLNFWIDVVDNNGYSLEQLATAFLESDEYATNFGDPDTQTNEEFVEILYNNILGRISDPGGFDFWTGVLEGGTPKNAVLLLFATAPENQAASPYIDTLTEGLGGNYYFASDGKGDPGDGLNLDDDDGKVDISFVTVDAVGPASAVDSGIINLDDFLADPRFDGIDGHGMTAVIIDTGIDLNHPAFGPDLDGNGISDRIIYAQDFTQDGDGTANDIQGHGSNVASIVGSSDPAYLGVAPGVNIIALQALGNDGSGQNGWIEKALQWVVENAVAYNIVSVNLSLGDGTNVPNPAAHPFGYADELVALRQLGVITVAAAGNSYFDYQTQGASNLAADPNVIAVGAVWNASYGKVTFLSGAEDTTTGVDRVTSFSQRSTDLPTIFAPGAFITGAAPGGGSAAQGGTSQASPHIAGIAVLAQQLAEQELGRRLTPDEFASLLISTGDTIFDGDDEQDNVANTNADYRRVDVYALANAIVDLGGGGNTPPPSDIPGDASTSASLAIGASGTSDIGFALDSDWIRVQLEAGHGYDFALLGNDSGNGTLTDPYLRLRDVFGNVVAYDDDSGSGLDSLIDDFVPTQAGTYFLDAGAYASGTGSYTLAASTSGLQTGEILDSIDTGATINVGDSFTSSLDFDNDEDWVRVFLDAGTTYQIDLRGAQSGVGTIIDPLLSVFDQTGNVVALNDDGGDGLESQLFFTADSSAFYYLSATSFRASDLGSYQLSIIGVDNGDIPGDLSTAVEILPDQTISSELDYLGDSDWIAFFAFAGEQFLIDLDGAGASPLSDPLLRLYDENGFEIASDDDGGPGLNSSLLFNFQTTGWYYLSAEAYANSRTGGYDLTVSSTGILEVPSGLDTPFGILPGETIVSSLDFLGDQDWFIFDVAAGAQYSITLEGTGEASELHDPLLRIYDSNGFQVVANDDSGGTLDSQIDYFSPFDERLFISAEAYAGAGTGDYYLTVV